MSEPQPKKARRQQTKLPASALLLVAIFLSLFQLLLLSKTNNTRQILRVSSTTETLRVLGVSKTTEKVQDEISHSPIEVMIELNGTSYNASNWSRFRRHVLPQFLPKQLHFVSWGGMEKHIKKSYPEEVELVPKLGSHVFGGKLHDRAFDSMGFFAHYKGNGNAARKNYTTDAWETYLRNIQMNFSGRVLGIYMIGDELNGGSNKGSSILERYQNKTEQALPFSYFIRDYYFPKLKDAAMTKVVPLGTMTCRDRKILCDIAPPKVCFTKLLSPAFLLEDSELGSIQKASKRPRRCFYAGSERADRKQMTEYFNKTNGCEVLVTPGFLKGLNRTEYKKTLLDTSFSLVPRGNSPETHRLAEVLQTGGIPVMLDVDAEAPHQHSYPEPIPMVRGPSWEAVEARMNAMTDEMVDAMQHDVLAWWKKYFSCVQEDMRWILAQSKALSVGQDLCHNLRS